MGNLGNLLRLGLKVYTNRTIGGSVDGLAVNYRARGVGKVLRTARVAESGAGRRRSNVERVGRAGVGSLVTLFVLNLGPIAKVGAGAELLLKAPRHEGAIECTAHRGSLHKRLNVGKRNLVVAVNLVVEVYECGLRHGVVRNRVHERRVEVVKEMGICNSRSHCFPY